MTEHIFMSLETDVYSVYGGLQDILEEICISRKRAEDSHRICDRGEEANNVGRRVVSENVKICEGV